jgi:hypothetical protein
MIEDEGQEPQTDESTDASGQQHGGDNVQADTVVQGDQVVQGDDDAETSDDEGSDDEGSDA